MRKLVIAVTLLAAGFSFSIAQKTQVTAKRKTVSAATIANLPAGKSYEVDLRRKGTLYNFNGNGTDFSRVAVRTATGVKTLAELFKLSNTDTKGQLTIGAPEDLRGFRIKMGGGGINFTCQGLFCGCSGDKDCNDMFSGAACGPIAWCNEDTGRCFCVARA